MKDDMKDDMLDALAWGLMVAAIIGVSVLLCVCVFLLAALFGGAAL